MSDLPDHIIKGSDASVFKKVIANQSLNTAIWENAVPESVQHYFNNLQPHHIENSPFFKSAKLRSDDPESKRFRFMVGHALPRELEPVFNREAINALPSLSGLFNTQSFFDEFFKTANNLAGGRLTDIELRLSTEDKMIFHVDGGRYRILSTLSTGHETSPFCPGQGSTLLLPKEIAKKALKDNTYNWDLEAEASHPWGPLDNKSLYLDTLPVGVGNAALITGMDSCLDIGSERFPTYHNAPLIPYRPTNRLRAFLIATIR